MVDMISLEHAGAKGKLMGFNAQVQVKDWGGRNPPDVYCTLGDPQCCLGAEKEKELWMQLSAVAG